MWASSNSYTKQSVIGITFDKAVFIIIVAEYIDSRALYEYNGVTICFYIIYLFYCSRGNSVYLFFSKEKQKCKQIIEISCVVTNLFSCIKIIRFHSFKKTGELKINVYDVIMGQFFSLASCRLSNF